MTKAKITYQVNGIKDENQKFHHQQELDDFKLEISYKTDQNRSLLSLNDLECEEDDIINVVFEDGFEWVGSALDITEIYGAYSNELKNNREADQAFILPSSISDGQSRGAGEAIVKFFNKFILKKSASIAADVLAKNFDKKRMGKEGLYFLKSDFTLEPFRKNKLNPNKKVLLFIHGTASSFHGSFGKIHEVQDFNLWSSIQEKYGESILVFNHWTISKSPITNVKDLLKDLPEELELDIISSSRGGLIADILCRCSDLLVDQEVFDELELKRIKDENTSIGKDALSINELAKRKKIKVQKLIRVACPGRGTKLLDQRIDHLLNGILNALGAGIGAGANPLYASLKNFIMAVVKNRHEADAFPGLNAMDPNSIFQSILNNPLRTVEGQLIVIEGDAEFGGNLKHSFLVVLTNVLFLSANDFVINTDSMRFGAVRQLPLYIFLSKDQFTGHFNYFKNQNTQEAIAEAVNWDMTGNLTSFQKIEANSGERGVALSLIDFKDEDSNNITGQRPIVILLPGIMGSNLYVNDEKIWINFEAMYHGALVDQLDDTSNGSVTAKSIVGRHYSSLVEELKEQKYDVCVFPYDWRKPIKSSAKLFHKKLKELETHNQEIKIIAHSMGGLVVKTLIATEANDWNKYINKEGSKLILLGTPWYGSHLVMEALTGHSSRIKQIAFIDFKNSKSKVLETIQSYQGIYDLLPVGRPDETLDEKFESSKFWKDLNKGLDKGNFSIPDKEFLDGYLEYKALTKNTTIGQHENVYYIAGASPTTVNDYTFKNSIFGTHLKYLSTHQGDGSVTYHLGIPQDINKANLYYTNTNHTFLAAEEKLFSGILDLLKTSLTNRFRKRPYQSLNRSADTIANRSSKGHLNYADTLDNLFDAKKKTALSKTESTTPINVKIVHGDLKFASYPVVVGHFKGDGIISAESALNEVLDNKLIQRFHSGKYVGDLQENIIIYQDLAFKGGVVIGLGEIDELTEFLLKKSIEQAVIDFAFHIRDNVLPFNNNIEARGLSPIIIGSGFGSLGVERSLAALLNGVNEANQKIKILNDGLTQITELEIIELYEDRAREAFYALRRLKENNSRSVIEIPNNIEGPRGGRKKLAHNSEGNWWHSMSTKWESGKDNKEGIAKIIFTSAEGKARVRVENKFTATDTVESLLIKLSQSPKWDSELSMVLFHILIPNNFKEILQHQNYVLWKMDKKTASYPWELFHDTDFGAEPTFVNAGFIRQLKTDSYRVKPNLTKNNEALVIGDPIYKDLPQLPGAKREAEDINQKINDQNNWTSVACINETGENIFRKLFNNKFQILHVSGHGVYDPENKKIGIVTDTGEITPAILESLGPVPEFVFINCCYSGTMNSLDEKYYSHKYKFAANIGTQLIEMGVSAVVIAGWAVDDSAAENFAQVFYDRMFEGYHFGEAVKMARKSCYDKYPNNITWGAYQCYGSPWYRLSDNYVPNTSNETYATEEEVLTELYNLNIKTATKKEKDLIDIEQYLENIIEKARKADLYTPSVIQQEAKILANIDRLEKAINCYSRLRKKNSASFTVKAMEQYYNLQAKKLFEDGSPTKEEIERLQKRFKSLIDFGETTERYSIAGSFYKRLACTKNLPDETKRKSYLDAMILHYKKGYQESQSPKVYAYPFTNFLIAQYFENENEKVDFEGREQKIPTILKKLNKKLSSFSLEHEDFWEDIARVNVQMAMILYSSAAKAEALVDEIIPFYKEAWKKNGTLSHYRSERDNLTCIQYLMNHFSGKETTKVKKQKACLAKLMENLEKLKNENNA